ncbi:DASS family sodium-coupled anion symporter [Halodesulfurarchaeum sp. HSR-GB]|uniref:SLC13 family permease n=1 Tax=Halodesulfurarchaeum sp. HSR-GB TaxID=3074077 RepID=UPI0028637913|nr:DASS family sodium-coupled anion symporter [Halodesulfurarchaeum sp. HSR-GB]MDR5656996.1 DASS family sodium-coupled anion symporter [Halodesulfurarchaeum sp. HSR-GB]
MSEATSYNRRQQIGLGLGPALFVLTHLFVTPAGLQPAANAVLASTLWIATWWVTEAAPIPVTSLLPIVLFPVCGVTSAEGATAPYANPIVFLFLGGFLVALAIERWGLHRRIALKLLVRFGTDSRRLILGFMLITAFLSMWLSNTATAMMMVPIGMGVVAQRQALREPTQANPLADRTADVLDAGSVEQSNFGTALLLGIAYAASIGGVATLIGTPPNAILAGVARAQLGIQIGFVEWMQFGLPLAVSFLLVTWVLLLRLVPPEETVLPTGHEQIRSELHALGPMGTGERRVVAVFLFLVLGWLLRPFVLEPLVPGLTDTVIAVVAGILVFLVPVDLRRGEFLLRWQDTTRVPWGVLVLFGAGFSIANAFQVSGLSAWIAGHFVGLRGVEFVWVLLAIATLVVFLSEIASNSATASLFIPIMAGLGAALLVSPLALMATVSVAASFAFMLPVATPPNAIVFGSGYLTIPDMARVGFWLNLVGIAFLTVASSLWLPVVWG